MSFLHKKTRIMLIAALIGGLLIMWQWLPICPISPVFNVWTEHEQHLVSISYRLNKQDIDSLTRILESDNHIFHICNSMIFVAPKLFFDEELIWNYTSKAGIAFPDDNYILDH